MDNHKKFNANSEIICELIKWLHGICSYMLKAELRNYVPSSNISVVSMSGWSIALTILRYRLAVMVASAGVGMNYKGERTTQHHHTKVTRG